MRQIACVSAIPALLVVIVSACGGGSGEANQIEKVSRAFLVAFSTGDPAACELLTASGKRAFVTDTGVSCGQAVKECCLPSQRREPREAENVVLRVKVNGDNATAKYTRPRTGLPNTLRLVKTKGGWLIDDAIYPRLTDPSELK